MLRVLCCGSRVWTDIVLIRITFHEVFFVEDTKLITIIHGDNGYDANDNALWGKPDSLAVRGADKLCGRVAMEFGFQVQVFTPEWNRLGRKAGKVRNSVMLIEGRPDFVLAFTDSTDPNSGTADMVQKAEKAGVPHRIIHHE